MSIKKKMIDFIESLLLIKKYRQNYFEYYFTNKKTIYKKLKENGIEKIRPVRKSIWKLWYNTCYFSGEIKDSNGATKQVFVKSMGPLLKDCYENEVVVNKYIQQKSEYLSKRIPKMILNFIINDFYIIIYEYIEMVYVYENPKLVDAIKDMLLEYSSLGIIHTDFGFANMGQKNDDYYFFDYGTSICPLSDKIRVRNDFDYNYLDHIIAPALELIDNPDFYYDDAIHCGIDDIKREGINYLVGKDRFYFAKLGEQTYKYRLEKAELSDNVYLLKRCN